MCLPPIHRIRLAPLFLSTVAILLLPRRLDAQQWVLNPANGHRYALTTTAMTWPDANLLACRMGYQLATVRSQAEQTWIVSTFGTGNYWIGLSDEITEGTWAWSSRETPAPSFTAWNSGEPNSGRAENYAACYANASGRWADIPNGWAYRGLLEDASGAGRRWDSWIVFDGTREQYTRGQDPNNGFATECLTLVPQAFAGPAGAIRGMWAALSDANDSTGGHTYQVVLRPIATGGGPDIAAPPLYEGPVTAAPFGSGSGRGVHPICATFNPPVPPSSAGFFFGVRFPNAPSTYPADGPSIAASSGAYHDPVSPNRCGEHPRRGVSPGVAWNVYFLGPMPFRTQPAGGLAWEMGLMFEEPTMQPYAIDPVGPPGCTARRGVMDTGFAGFWPDVVDVEGYGNLARIGWRVEAGNFPGGIALVFLSRALLPTPVQIPGIGSLQLDPADPVFGALILDRLLDGAGVAFTTPLDPPPAARAALLGTVLNAQALLIQQATFGLTLGQRASTSF